LFTVILCGWRRIPEEVSVVFYWVAGFQGDLKGSP
jgi:hypothetical protein